MKPIHALVGIALIIIVGLGFLSLKNTADLKTWSSYETLTAADLNANFTEALAEVDSFRAHLKDSLDTRYPDIIPLWWTMAFADSIAANDSLTIHIVKDSPLGDAQGLFVQNAEGVVETVALYLDFELPNAISILDSIRIPLWTEAITADSDYVAFSVFDDSTVTAWKAKLTANGSDSLSTTARESKTARLTGISLTGGRIRLKAIVQTISDSLFVGMPLAYVRNP